MERNCINLKSLNSARGALIIDCMRFASSSIFMKLYRWMHTYMMLVIFTLLLISLLFAWFRCERIALSFFILTLVLVVWLFLFEIYSPEYGFKMPWIQT